MQKLKGVLGLKVFKFVVGMALAACLFVFSFGTHAIWSDAQAMKMLINKGRFNSENGEKLTESTVISHSCEYIARWRKNDVGNNFLKSLYDMVLNNIWYLFAVIMVISVIVSDFLILRKYREKKNGRNIS